MYVYVSLSIHMYICVRVHTYILCSQLSPPAPYMQSSPKVPWNIRSSHLTTSEFSLLQFFHEFFRFGRVLCSKPVIRCSAMGGKSSCALAGL